MDNSDNRQLHAQAVTKRYKSMMQTMSKSRQVIALFDGMLRFVNNIKSAINDNDLQQRFEFIDKTTDVINALQNALDFDRGEAISQQLNDFYRHILFRLLSLHKTPSITTCDDIILELTDMRDAWIEVDEQLSSNK